MSGPLTSVCSHCGQEKPLKEMLPKIMEGPRVCWACGRTAVENDPEFIKFVAKLRMPKHSVRPASQRDVP